MTSLAWCVLALGVGCVTGASLMPDAQAGTRLAIGAAGGVVLAIRLGLTGYVRAARGLAGGATLALGIGLGGAGEGRAWDPPGIDVRALEHVSDAGDPVLVEGTLRRDAWVTSSGGVALDIDATVVHWRARRDRTRVGMRLLVAGERAQALRGAWTRGRHVVAPVVAVRRPLPYRNFGTPDAERDLARRGLRVFATVKSASLVTTRAGPWWDELAARARAHVRMTVSRHTHDAGAAATITAILIGDRSHLRPDQIQALQHAGVYHVVAISGGNVAIWLALLVWVPRAAGAGTASGVAWLAIGLAGFALVVDGGASVARAVTVAAVAIAARWWDVRASALQCLLVAAGLQLAVEPLAWCDPGCVLSFGAAAALVVVAAAWTRAKVGRVRQRRAYVRAGVALLAVGGATLAVELVLLPVTARWFQMATAAGLLANLLAIPAMSVVQVAGLLLVPAASVWPALGDAMGALAGAGVDVLFRSADIVALAPWLVRDVPPPSIAVLAAYYAALALLVREGMAVRASRSGRGAVARAAAGAASLAAALVWILTGGVERSAPSPWQWPVARDWQTQAWHAEGWLVVTILDVGQGDATLVRFPSGPTWLVDAGGSAADAFDIGARVTAPAIWALGHRRLDRVVVTHAHPDHAAGLPAVIRRFRPREVLDGVRVDGDQGMARVLDAARSVAARPREVAEGESLAAGSVVVRVLHPERPDWERRRVRNDDSVVLWLRYGDVGILLPGDVGASVESRIAGRIAAAPLTVVRLAHHGSASSTTPALLQHLRPVLAIASAGRGNRFDHPAPVVSRRLAERGVPLLRTDESGAIQLATNGRVLLVRTAAGEEGSITAGRPRPAWWPARRLPSDRASRRPG